MPNTDHDLLQSSDILDTATLSALATNSSPTWARALPPNAGHRHLKRVQSNLQAQRAYPRPQFLWLFFCYPRVRPLKERTLALRCSPERYYRRKSTFRSQHLGLLKKLNLTIDADLRIHHTRTVPMIHKASFRRHHGSDDSYCVRRPSIRMG